MAGVTIVDQLIVKLGLDPKNFTKGQKQAAASIVSTEREVKRSASGMSSALTAVAGRFLTVAAAVVAVKKSVQYVSDLSTSVRRLGIDSRNFNIAANELKNFQNIAEMMGGKGDEATRTIGNITKAVYDLAYNGQISDSLIMLGRLGVRFQDTAGNARDFKDIILDTEKAIQSRMNSGTLTRANANQMLAQAGFDPGLAQAILAGNVQQQLTQQQSRRQVTADVQKAAETWEKSATNHDQAVEAAALRVLPTEAKAGTFLNDKAAAAAEYASDATLKGSLQDIGGALTAGADAVKKGMSNFVGALESVGGNALRSSFPKGRAAYEQTLQKASAKYGLDPEFVAGVIQTESGWNPAAVNGSHVGMGQLSTKYFNKAGLNPHQDVEMVAKELKRLMDLGAARGEADPFAYAIQAYHDGVTGLDKIRSGEVAQSAESAAYAGAVARNTRYAGPTPLAQSGAGGKSAGDTEVNIGKIEVQTQATDAEGIGRTIAGATRRKIIAAQADTGMN